MEEFLSSHGVLYEHHNLLTDTQAVEDLRRRGIKSLPVTIVDDTEVIIGYYPKKLILALKLDVTVDLSGKTSWLAEKYEIVMSAAIRATAQVSQDQARRIYGPLGPRPCLPPVSALLAARASEVVVPRLPKEIPC